MPSFNELQLSPVTLNAVAAMGFETPTAIQEQAIPHLLAGRDIIAQARTGTGKTAAFGIPLVERLGREANLRGPVALVLVPTRELALQVADELAQIAKGTRLRIIPIYGGVGMNPQIDGLRSPAPTIIVATPGRLLDHLQQRTARLDGVRVLVLDEADRMLDMGFLPDVERVLRALPEQRQTSLFSATVPEPIRKLSQRFLRDPASVRVETGPTVVPLAEQFKIEVTKAEKTRALVALLAKEKPECAIIFTRTKHLARRLAVHVGKSGWNAVALQGNMTQAQRERAMESFRNGYAKVLVATDIASRGLDVAEVSHVINFDIPHEPDAYVHRVGRTARMGRSGRAFTFVQPDQGIELRDVQRAAGLQLEAYDVGPLPAPSEENRLPGDQPPFHARFSERHPVDAPRMRAPQQSGPSRFGSPREQPRDQRPYRAPTRALESRQARDAPRPGGYQGGHSSGAGRPPRYEGSRSDGGYRSGPRQYGGPQRGPPRYQQSRGPPPMRQEERGPPPMRAQERGPPPQQQRGPPPPSQDARRQRRGSDEPSYGSDNGRGWW